MSEDSSTGMKTPSFDGKKENYQMWWTRFEAFASVKNVERALEDDADMPSTAAAALLLDPTQSGDKPALSAVRRNKVAWAQLTLALNSESLLALMNGTKDTNWPSGLAKKVAVKLKKNISLMTEFLESSYVEDSIELKWERRMTQVNFLSKSLALKMLLDRTIKMLMKKI